MSNAAAALSATLADEFARCGVREVIVAPGSRSTPLALAVVDHPRLTAHVVLDERSAGFVALGIGRATGRPALVVTTSGTAAVELHPAVVEAHHSNVPLIVCTADRPAELHDVGAAQTIDQRNLYGPAVRWYGDLGTADGATAAAWRSFAARGVAEATGRRPGPVQLNLGFREPLLGDPGPLPPGRGGDAAWHRRVRGEGRAPVALLDDFASRWPGRRGVIVAGAGVDDPAAVLGLAQALGWPVLADPRSGCRLDDPAAIAHADALLRVASLAAWAQPEVVVHLGELPASKVVATWLAREPADRVVERVAVNDVGAFWDPDRRVDVVVEAAVGGFCRELASALGPAPVEGLTARSGSSASVRPSGWLEGWLEGWRAADDAASAVIEAEFGATAGRDGPLEEPAIARQLLDAVGRDEPVVVSSSMPVRDVEWYGPRRAGLAVFANRGANGIDGVVSTAVGVALAAAPRRTWLLIGDLAFLHDANALLWAPRRALSLRIVVVDNNGGGIFSFLPQRSALDPALFEQLFGTPHDCDLAGLAATFGAEVRSAAGRGEWADGLGWLQASTAPVAVLIAHTDRQANASAHDRVHEAVAEAVASLNREQELAG